MRCVDLVMSKLAIFNMVRFPRMMLRGKSQRRRKETLTKNDVESSSRTHYKNVRRLRLCPCVGNTETGN